MPPYPAIRSVFLHYGLAAATALGALALRLALQPMLQDRLPLLFFLLAVVVSGWQGGLGPALFCTGFSAVLAQIAFFGGMDITAVESGNAPMLLLFLLVGMAISLIAGSMKRSLLRQQRQGEELSRALGKLQGIATTLHERERRVVLLGTISNQLVTTTEPHALMPEILDQLAGEVNAERVLYFLVTPDGYGLELANHRGYDPSQLAMLARLASGYSLSSVVAKRREPLIVPDLTACSLPEADFLRSIGVKVDATHPLIAGGRLIGTLSFSSGQRPPFQEDEVFFLRAACDQIAAVLERANLFEERLTSQRRLQTALEAGRMGSWDLVLESKTLVASTGCKLNFGRSPDEPFTYEQLYSAIHPEDRERWVASVREAAESLHEFTIEYRIFTPDRSVRIISIRGSVEREASGRAIAMSGISMEVTRERLLENLMAESEARWRELAEAMPQLVWTCTPDGQVDFLSRQWQDYTGVPVAEHFGTRWLEIIHPEDRNPLVGIWAHSTATGRPYDTEYRMRRADGVYRWFKARGVAALDGHGQIKKWFGSNTDIEDLKTAELAVREREEQLRLITEHAPVFLAQADLEHRYRFTNRAYAARYGCQPEDIIGRPIAEIVGPRAYESVRAHMDAACAGRQVEFEMELNYDQLGERWVHVVFVPDRNGHGEIIGFLAVLSDITQRKQTEMELKKARDEALAASQAKDIFLSTLSHELRTPLNPVLLLASDALQNPELPPEVRADFQSILKNVSLEARLIDDLLDLTRIARGKVSLELQPTDAHALLHESYEFVRAEIEAKQLRLDFALHARRFILPGDPVRLQQIFWNLLRNAVKFTPAGGSIQVRSRDAEGDMLAIEVVDSGIGLQAEEIARIFETFSQGDHAASGNSERYGGLGLGLSICKLLVQLHEGRISASSPGVDRGSMFTVELPVPKTMTVPESNGPRADEIKRTPGSASLRILLVEDHEPTRHALSRLLERRGHHVTIAETGAAALESARQAAFDVVVSDLGLPDITGHALMSELSRAHGLRGVALSGYGAEQDIQRSLEAGFLRHLTKPVDMKMLLETLAEIGPAPSI